ncbi:MAG TPA: prolyl oligopeptidase family serine peptidase, partial [Polyangiaceae bacterium]|nr:prolyl oligopeptidase family serine peptidase [Polyangiaceae bacterium]
MPVYLHTLGADPDRDEAAFGHGVSPSLDLPANAWAWVVATPGSGHLVAAYNDGVRHELTIFTAPRGAFAGPKTPWKRVTTYDDKVVGLDVRGDEAFLHTRRGAPRGQIVRLDLRRPELGRASVFVPQDPSAVLEAMGVAKDGLYVRKLDGGIGKLFRASWGGALEPVDPGVGGAAGGFVTEPGAAGALLFVTSWTSSTKLVAVDPARKSAADTGIIPPSKVSFEGVVATEEKAKSADGTMVPISILRRADAPRDGSGPAYLLGYASYGNVGRPYFEPMRLAWLERGGTWAYCHARGGGEYGEAWHEAGKLGTKTNTIEDYLACARHLVEAKYSSPGRIGGHG